MPLSQGDIAQAAQVAVQLCNTALQNIEDLKNTSLPIENRLKLVAQLQEIENQLESLTKTLQSGEPLPPNPQQAGSQPGEATEPSGKKHSRFHL